MMFTMSSTFSLVEVTAEYLDSPRKLHTAMHLCIIFKHGQKSQSRCISLQATWACRPQVLISARLSLVVGLQAPDTTLKPWYCPTGLMQNIPWHNLWYHKFASVSSPNTKKKKKEKIQCYLACSKNSDCFETSIFFPISQITKFLSLRRLPPSKMSGSDIAPIYFEKHTKWANFHILLPKNAKRGSPNALKIFPGEVWPLRNSIQTINVFKTYQITKPAWPGWIFSCRRYSQIPTVRVFHVLSCRHALLVAFSAVCCSCVLHSLKQSP